MTKLGDMLHKIDKILNDVFQEKEIQPEERKDLLIFNNKVRECCPVKNRGDYSKNRQDYSKNRRDYSKYAKVTKRAQYMGWSISELYEKLCRRGGINALCGYFDKKDKTDIDVAMLGENVHQMQTMMSLSDRAHATADNEAAPMKSLPIWTNRTISVPR